VEGEPRPVSSLTRSPEAEREAAGGDLVGGWPQEKGEEESYPENSGTM